MGPKARLGVRVAALVCYLNTLGRMPMRLIVAYLARVHQLRVAGGTIAGLLQHVYQRVRPAVDALRTQARASPVLHGDETGWRQGGRNGYIWVFCTPDAAGPAAVRYYAYDASRGAAVVTRLLHGFQGVLNSVRCASLDSRSKLRYIYYNDPPQRSRANRISGQPTASRAAGGGIRALRAGSATAPVYR